MGGLALAPPPLLGPSALLIAHPTTQTNRLTTGLSDPYKQAQYSSLLKTLQDEQALLKELESVAAQTSVACAGYLDALRAAHAGVLPASAVRSAKDRERAEDEALSAALEPSASSGGGGGGLLRKRQA